MIFLVMFPPPTHTEGKGGIGRQSQVTQQHWEEIPSQGRDQSWSSPGCIFTPYLTARAVPHSSRGARAAVVAPGCLPRREV